MSVDVAESLRGGLSVTDWSDTHIWIADDRARHMPFMPRASQIYLRLAKERARAICREKHIPVRANLVKPRRSGWTTDFHGSFLTRACTEQRVKLRYLAKTGDDRPKQFAAARYMYDHLDERVRPALANPEAQMEMQFPSLSSLFDSASASSPRSGRGLGYAEQLLDEWAHVDSTMAEQLLLDAAMQESSRLGDIWRLSTPNGMNNHFAVRIHLAMGGECDDVNIFLPHWLDDECITPGLSDDEVAETLATITPEETDAVERFHRQFGQTLLALRTILVAKGRLHGAPTDRLAGRELACRLYWRRRKIRQLGTLFFQEYPEDLATCFIALGQSFFGQTAIAHQRSIARPAIRSERNGDLLVYVEPVLADPQTGYPHDYIVATDTSMGVGRDPAMSAVLDFDTGEIVAVLCGQYPPQLMAELTIRHLCLPYNEALWAPEISPEHSGHAALAHVRQQVGYGNIYRYRPPGRVDPKARLDYGFPTTSSTRPVLLEDLRAALEEGAATPTAPPPLRLNDPRILAHLQTFKLRDIEGRHERYEAERGAHDEGVIVAGIAWYVRQHGRIRPGCY